MSSKAQVFLCYARPDRQQVEVLYEKLAEHKLKPWMDIRDILAGERWEFAVHRAIQSSQFFLACLSKNSVTRRGYVQRRSERLCTFLMANWIATSI